MNWNIDPVLLDLKIVKLRYYSLLFATGLFAAYFLVSKFLREKGLPNDYPDKIFIRIVISLVIGAHLVHLIFYEPSAFIHNPMRIFEIGSGLASHGGVLGALFGLWLFCHKYKESFFEIADMIASSVGITGACIRMGNFFNSEIIGRPTDVPWAITFLKVDNLPRHPTQLYEAIALFIMFPSFYFLYKKQKEKRKPGFFLFLFLGIYFMIRILIEFVKEYQSEMMAIRPTFTMGQWLSLPVVLISFYMVFLLRKPKLSN